MTTHNNQPKPKPKPTVTKKVNRKLQTVHQQIEHQVEVNKVLMPQNVSKKQYVAAVKKYTKDMDKVINTMTVSNDKKDVHKKLKEVQNIVVTYESKVGSKVTVPEIKPIDKEVKQANEKYIKSLSKIETALETKDKTLKEEGYNEFVEGHVYLSAAAYEAKAMSGAGETAETNEPSLENKSLELITYTADDKPLTTDDSLGKTPATTHSKESSTSPEKTVENVR